MSTKKPQEPAEESAEGPAEQTGEPTEITLRDGETITFEAPRDGTAHVVVNVVPPQRSIGFFSSCVQGCGCLVLVVLILSAIGSFIR